RLARRPARAHRPRLDRRGGVPEPARRPAICRRFEVSRDAQGPGARLRSPEPGGAEASRGGRAATRMKPKVRADLPRQLLLVGAGILVVWATARLPPPRELLHSPETPY